MIRMLLRAGVVVCSLAVSLAAAGLAAQQPQQQTSYTLPEYNAFQACRSEQNPQQRLKVCDDFVAKFPSSTLMPFVYQLYYGTHNQLRNYPKVIEYADKALDLGDKLEQGSRLDAIYWRTFAFHFAFNPEKDVNAVQQLTRARDLAREGITILNGLAKPDNLTPEQFAEQKKGPLALMNYTVGFASLQLKEYASAVEALRTALTFNANDAVTLFRLGLAYLQQDPPSHMDGFWALARSIALKGPSEAQVRAYLRNQMLRYQLTGCEPLLDAQMNELLALAGGTAERPAEYRIPSAADLDSVRKESANVLEDLRAGGGKAKIVFLATCGLEFPQVTGKVLEVSEGNSSVILKAFTASTQEEMEAATTPNLEVKITDQPEAKRLEKDNYMRFSGILAGYEPEPFLLKWDKAKVNPEDIPPEKPEAPAKAPTKRPPPKRPPTKSPAR